MKRILLIIGLVIGTLLGTGISIQCYTCTSTTDVRCGDPFSNELRSNLCSNVTSLKATKYDIKSSNLPRSHIRFMQGTFTCYKVKVPRLGVFRGCALGEKDDANTCKELNVKLVNDKDAYCELCNSDGCNGSTRISLDLSLPCLLLLTILSVYFLPRL